MIGRDYGVRGIVAVVPLDGECHCEQFGSKIVGIGAVLAEIC
jgi:hypothetical protein